MISTGASHCAALSVYGRIYTWGEARCGQLGLGRPLVSQSLPVEVGPTAEGAELPDCRAVACGEFHTVALTADGVVYSWGLSNRGPVSRNTLLPESWDSGRGRRREEERIKAIRGGGSTLISEGGTVVCWPVRASSRCPAHSQASAHLARLWAALALCVCGDGHHEASLLRASTRGRLHPLLEGAGFYDSTPSSSVSRTRLRRA